MDIFKIAAIGLTGAVLAALLREEKREFAIYAALATVLTIFVCILYQLSAVFEFLKSWQSQLSYGEVYLPIILKILGTAYLSDFVAQVCRDAGEGAIAAKIELAGKVMIFYLAMPVMVSIMELIQKILPASG